MDQNDGFVRSEELVDDPMEDGLPEDLLSEIDKALEGLTAPQPFQVAEAEPDPEIVLDALSHDPGHRQMQETFIELARNTLSPIDRYMKAISLGENYRELLEISELIVTPLISKTEAVGLNEHAQDVTFFRSLILLALGERDSSSAEAMKEVVMEGFNKLSERFGLGFRGYRLAVRNLVAFYRALRSSESISDADVRKFFGIGVPSLTWVRRTKVAEIASLSGISAEAVREIRRLAYACRSLRTVESAQLAKGDVMAPASIRPSLDLTEINESEVAEADVFSATNDIEVTPTHSDT